MKQPEKSTKRVRSVLSQCRSGLTLLWQTLMYGHFHLDLLFFATINICVMCATHGWTRLPSWQLYASNGVDLLFQEQCSWAPTEGWTVLLRWHMETIEWCLWDVSEVFKGVDALQTLTVTTTTQIQLKEVGSRNVGASAHQSKCARVPEVDSLKRVEPKWTLSSTAQHLLWARPMMSWLSLWCHDYVMGWCHLCSMWHHYMMLCHGIVTDGVCNLTQCIMVHTCMWKMRLIPLKIPHMSHPAPAYLRAPLLPEPSTTLLLIF